MQYKKKFISDRILEAGLAEYLEKGYRAGNISTIAQNAGVPVGNLYRYFDGKAGLLDALVKKTYNEFPKIIDGLARVDVETGMQLSELMSQLTLMVVSLFEQRGKEIILLVDKCASTRYEDFLDKITDQIAGLVYQKLYQERNETNRRMSKLATRAFIGSVLDVLRFNLSRADMEVMISKVLNFYFYEVNNRL